LLTLSKNFRPANPVQGVKESKPRFKTAREELPELSRSYLEIRNQQMRTKNLTAEMVLAERRGQLIEKRLVEQQAAYIFVSLRQRILNLGQTWARRFVGLNDVREAKALIDEMARSTLTELAQFPERITDPNWLDEVDGEELRPMSPAQARRVAQAKETAHAKRKIRRKAAKDKTGKWGLSTPQSKPKNRPSIDVRKADLPVIRVVDIDH
jgi:hypothetical protein